MCKVKSDDGQRNCPKHVEFYSKDEFENLVHLVGFIIRRHTDILTSVAGILRTHSKTNKLCCIDGNCIQSYNLHHLFMSFLKCS